MSLRGKTVRIIVNEPFEWSYGNLFGTIEDDRGGKALKIRLIQKIKGNTLKSNLIELRPRYEKETFKPLLQNYSVTVGGALIEDNSDKSDYIIIGTVTID
jgi:hypothetical protein